jgi:hypothetical protein
MLYVPCVLSRDVHAQNLEEKNLEILSTTDGKKKLEIDCKNLETSEICTDEKSLEKIYLYEPNRPTSHYTPVSCCVCARSCARRTNDSDTDGRATPASEGRLEESARRPQCGHAADS